MEELSERAKRVLGVLSDGSLQGDLVAALDEREGLVEIEGTTFVRAVPK